MVVKDAQPDDPQDFSFTAGGGLSARELPARRRRHNGNALSEHADVLVVAPGSGHSVAESAPAGWVLSSATCSDGSPVSNIDVGPGETVTCTFANQKRGKIVVVKDARPNDPQDFSSRRAAG